MVVQHNMQAMNANRMLNVTTSTQAKSTEKLSSGYKINRAADDAAGLTISEKMRKQIKGLDQASTNAEDGVSSVQTAEGALTEVHSMLQRMNELAVQASNGTNSESDRSAIQDEISQLTTEIDRVSETTKFNETYLLKGNVDGTSKDMNVNAHDAGLAGKLVDNGNGTSTFTLENELKDGDKVTIAGKEYTIGTAGTAGTALDRADLNTKTDGYAKSDAAPFDGTTTLKAGDSVTADGKTYTLSDNIAADSINWAAADTVTVGDITFTIAAGDGEAKVTDAAAGTGTIGLNKVKDYVNAALADGKQVTSSKFHTDVTDGGANATANAAVTTKTTIVSSLDKGEVSKAQLKDTKAATVAKAGAGDTSATEKKLVAGDSVTISGTTTTATEADPSSARDVYDAIDALDADGTHNVKVGSGVDAITYTVVDEANVDEDSFKLTKDMILSKIQDGTTVDVDGAGAVSVIGDLGSAGSAGDVISAKDAYAMMKDELQAASSIGTDKAAEVTSDGKGKFTIKQGTVSVKEGLSFNLHVGADADMTNKIGVDIESMSAASLGIKGINVKDNTGMAATYAIDAIADAVSKVSSQRSALGAVQNRLEHTIANVDNVVENTTSAESRIRDTDMAEEMVNYSKNNILAQAGQSMLAQANQSNQGVLSLLQ